MMKNSKIKYIVGGLGLYLIIAGISYFAFTKLIKTDSILSPQSVTQSRAKIDTSAPKTEECPINGEKYTKSEKDIWMTRRPLAIMVENHEDARPQSGLSSADAVYEAVAEGGVTRFMGIYYCGVAAKDVAIAPVRSSRIYFINWASEYGPKPIYIHVGGANRGAGETDPRVRALEALVDIGWRTPGGNDFDATFDSGYPLFQRNYERLDHAVATEHTMQISTDTAYKQADKRGFNYTEKNKGWDADFEKWSFKDGQPSQGVNKIAFDFFLNDPTYGVVWDYDQASNSYKRTNGGQPQIDLNNSQQLDTKNLVIMYMKAQFSIDAHKHSFYANIGSGNALYFQNGQVVKGTWSKPTRTDRTKFLDDKGKEMSFVRGKLWITALDLSTKVNY